MRGDLDAALALSAIRTSQSVERIAHRRETYYCGSPTVRRHRRSHVPMFALLMTTPDACELMEPNKASRRMVAADQYECVGLARVL
jgi:hypothetical protein